MESHVIAVARGYGGDARTALELFDAVAASAVLPPLECEMAVANGRGLAGDVLLFYVANGFAGVPLDLDACDWPAFKGWLRNTCGIAQPQYVVEDYTDLNARLEDYWPGMNVLKRARLLPAGVAAADAPREGVPMGGTAKQPICDSCSNALTFNMMVGTRRLFDGVVCRQCGKVQCSRCKGTPAQAPCKWCGGAISPCYDTYLVALARPAPSVPSRAAATPPAAGAGSAKKGFWRSLFGGPGAGSAPAAPAPAARAQAAAPPTAVAAASAAPVPAPASALECTVGSVAVKQSLEYGSHSSRHTMTASPAYRILVADVTVTNSSAEPRRFSSQQFSVVDRQGASVKASFYGVGDTLAESGAVITTESTTNDADGKPVVAYKGKLSTDVSFLEWVLQPHKTYADRLVFVIPATATGAAVRFSGS